MGLERCCRDAFDKIKEGLTADVIQAHPDYSRPFIVDTDASEIGMACILGQLDDQVIWIDSRKFTNAEAKWHIREKEALGIVWALQKFRVFLLGTTFTVRTDHGSLEWLLKAKSGRLCCWALLLSEFTPFTIKHRSGTSHSNVDAFTRTFAESDAFPDSAFIGAVTSFLPTSKEWMEKISA